MRMPNLDKRLEYWLQTPEKNAAGRLGLFRILLALTVLGSTYIRNLDELAQIPLWMWNPVASLRFMAAPPGEAVFSALMLVQTVSLVFILFGYQTRLSTLAYLISATMIEALRFSFGKVGHGEVFLFHYIPFVMLFYDWGQCYSIDAILRARRGQSMTDVHDGSWHHAWPFKFILLIFVTLYFGSAFIKITRGYWLSDWGTVSGWIVAQNMGTQTNPLVPIVTGTPILGYGVQLAGLMLEFSFPLALINHTWRALLFCSAVFFHASIKIFMHINFVAQVFVFSIFLDWQAIYDVSGIGRLSLWKWFARLPDYALIALPFITSVIVVLVSSAMRSADFLLPSEILSEYIIWAIAIPVAAVGLARAVTVLVRDNVLRQNSQREAVQGSQQ